MMNLHRLCRNLLALSTAVFPYIGSAAAYGQDQSAAVQIEQLDKSIREGDADRIQENVAHLKATRSAVPTIREAVRAHSDARLRKQLLSVLGGIPGQESTDALLDLMTDSREDVRYGAIASLENRRIERELQEREWGTLTDAIEKANPIRAGMAARILAKCPRHAVEKRAKPVIRRFIDEAKKPAETGTAHPAYLSPRVLKLNQFLLAFAEFPSSEILPLLKEQSTSDAPEVRPWLKVARGMAGDSSVAPDLRQMVENGADVSVRAVALRAYARALGHQAIPLLEQYAIDTTELADERDTGKKVLEQHSDDTTYPANEHRTRKKIMPLRIVARDELARLRSSEGKE